MPRRISRCRGGAAGAATWRSRCATAALPAVACSASTPSAGDRRRPPERGAASPGDRVSRSRAGARSILGPTLASSAKIPQPRLVASGAAMPATAVHRLELDLDVFAGPFDLLLSLVLREELDLLEVELADVVLAYLDHLEARDELDLEATTEFLVLIAALLELKSRLMLPGEEVEELDELAPAEAAEELVERMLRAGRFRGAGARLASRHDHGQSFLHRSAPLPPEFRRLSAAGAEKAYDPEVLGASLGALLRVPPPIDLSHIAMPRVTVAARLEVLRALLRR